MRRGLGWSGPVGVRRRSLRGVAWLGAMLLVVSGLSLSALTAAIVVAPTAIGPPSHAFTDVGRGPIPRAAFEDVRAIPARGPAAFGGDRVYDVDVDGVSYRVHEFTTDGEFILTRPTTVEYLVVGGGGGGGTRRGGTSPEWAGGGGAGGMLEGELPLTPSVHPITVGGGGAGGSTATGYRGGSGEDSTAFGLTAKGGGGGAASSSGARGAGTVDGAPGGSGGGGAHDGGAGSGGSGTDGQGFQGGDGEQPVAGQCPPCGGGGGGGAEGPGSPGLDDSGGAGGPGRPSSIGGVEVVYAGGGGGAPGVNVAGRVGGAGGAGGGGTGGSSGGVDGTGGGAGAGPYAGGSGIVIVRYPIPRSVWAPEATGGTVTEFIGDGTGGTVAGVRYRVHTFEKDGDLTVPDGSTIPEVDVLLVGGGGGGGSRHGGGGGGGGVLEVLGHPLGVTGAFPVVVGQGGAGTTAASAGQSGGDSVALGLTAIGGGRGAGLGHPALAGGSGGGANTAGATVGGRDGVQGNVGGAGVGASGNPEGGYGGGGGGGAGQVGFAATSGGAAETANGGRGGDGRVSTLSGVPVVYGGGGGGSISHRSTGVVGVGGLGGGGNGGSLGWELYDASSVGRALTYELFTHTLAHPSGGSDARDEAVRRPQFDTFFDASDARVTLRREGGAPLPTETHSVLTGDEVTPTGDRVNVLNWRSSPCPTTDSLYSSRAIGQSGAIGNETLNPCNNFSLRVTGWFVPREDGIYRFTVDSDDAADVRVGDAYLSWFYAGRGLRGIANDGSDRSGLRESAPLSAGVAYAFEARMEEGVGGEGLRVFWKTPDQHATSATTWWQNVDELIGDRPSGSPLSIGELDRFYAAASRFPTSSVPSRGLGTVTTQSLGATTPNTLNWAHPSSGASNELHLTSVIGVSGLADDFMLTVSGTFVPKEPGTYTFALSGDDAVDLAVDGTVIVAHYGQKGAPDVGDRQGTVTLEAGVPVHLTVRHHQRDGGAALRVFWRKPSQTSGWHQDAEELRSTGRDGVDGLGGGGGAGGFTAASNAAGGRGGDGVVVIRYPLARAIEAMPSEVREPIAGEGRSTAVLRWRQPAIDPPSPDADGYRIEYAPLVGGTWTDVTDATFGVDPEDAERVTATVSGLPEGAVHRFRVTPVGTVDGPSGTVVPVAKGGDVVTLVGDEVVHQFTTVGAGDAFGLRSERSVRYLIVAGGAGGASGRGGGGGGAGGLLSGVTPLAEAEHPIVVGGGGASVTNAVGPDGGDSVLSTSTGDLRAVGGGGGGMDSSTAGRPGGSGGGSRVNSNVAGGAATSGQGHAGGRGVSDSASPSTQPNVVGGGGGGAGGPGADGKGSSDGPQTGRGGPGLEDDITGESLWFAAGGGGGETDGRVPGLDNGGEGGGGSGAVNDGDGSPGITPGSGGGGGSSRTAHPTVPHTSSAGGAGADGIVVLRYAFAPSVPDAPSGLGGTPADGTVSLTWDAPTFTGGSPVLGYEVGRSTDDGTTWSDWEATGSTGTATTVGGLTNGTAYVFRVRALNAVGASDPSAPSAAITPRTVPDAPVIDSVTGGDGTLDVAFSVPSDGGATVTNIEYRIDDGPWTPRSPASASSPLMLDGLENERTYTVRLRAINVAGSSEESGPATGVPIEGFIADFVGGQAPGPAIEAAWAGYRASLTGSYDSFTLSSSLGGSVTVTHPTEVQKLADGLRTGTATSVSIAGVTWVVGTDCRQGGGPNVELSNVGSCTAGATAALRPDINNLNWGGIGSTLNQPTQRLTLVFRRTLP